MSYSQLNQDNTVLEFFNNRKKLYFLDIGANDGITLSNTYKLEKEYGWDGICSEPLPDIFKKLKKCRNIHNDKNAVYSQSGLTLDFSDAANDLLSGITKHIDAHHEAKNHKTVKVKTITLDKLLKKYKAPKTIHYMSLDTEGSEYEILKSVNHKDYKFLYINLEHNYIEPRRTLMRELLEQNGYLYKGENEFDDDYIHSSTLTGKYYHNNDYTKPITIKKVDKNKFMVSSDYWEKEYGEFKDGKIQFNERLGHGKIFYDKIEFSPENKWHRDNRKGRYKI